MKWSWQLGCPCDPQLARAIVELEQTAWPSDDPDERFPSAPETYAASIVAFEGSRAVGHTAVRKKAFVHRGVSYTGYGLSEVVVHPQWQRRGIGSEMIRRAADFISACAPDVSLFTCEPSRVGFYQRGGWRAAKDACLVGGTRERPFRSDRLGLTVMVRSFSSRAILHRADFDGADIWIELGENQLW